VHAGHGVRIDGDGDELPLRENLPVIVELALRVRSLGGLGELTDLDDRRIVGGGDESDAVVGWQHE